MTTPWGSDYLQFSGFDPLIRGSNSFNCRFWGPQVTTLTAANVFVRSGVAEGLGQPPCITTLIRAGVNLTDMEGHSKSEKIQVVLACQFILAGARIVPPRRHHYAHQAPIKTLAHGLIRPEVVDAGAGPSVFSCLAQRAQVPKSKVSSQNHTYDS